MRKIWMSHSFQAGLVVAGLAAAWLAGGAPVWAGI